MLTSIRFTAHLYFPFSYLQICLRELRGQAKLVLDVGCGQGHFMKMIPKAINVVGIDLYRGYLTSASKSRVYSSLILADLMYLPIRQEAVDVVLCLHALEHIKKNEGRNLLDFIDKVARQKIMVSTPVNFHPIRHRKYEEQFEDYLQLHKSFWDPEEFKRRGYKVIGYTFHFPFRDWILNSNSTFLKTVYELLASLLSPLVYFSPRNADYMVCIKRKKQTYKPPKLLRLRTISFLQK